MARGEPVRISAAEAVFQTMASLGCDTLFNLPGRGVYPLLNELAKVPQMGYVTAVHEASLAACADGYARARGDAAFLNIYMGSGTLNASSMLFLAQRDRIPLVVTATQTETWAVGADARAEIADVLGAMRGVVKWAWEVPTPGRVPEAIRRAYTIATTDPMGVTFLAIPIDFWAEEISYLDQPLNTSSLPTSRRYQGGDAVLDQLERCERPAVVIGAEAIRRGCASELVQLAEQTGAMIFAEPDAARVPVASAHPLYVGMLDGSPDLSSGADFMLHVGVNTYMPEHAALFGKGCFHVWLGSDGREANKVFAADIQHVGEFEGIVQALAVGAGARAGKSSVWRAQRERAEAAVKQQRARWEQDRTVGGWDGEPMTVARLFTMLRERLPADTVLVEQATTASRQLHRYFPVPSERHYFAASGSNQGWALGASAGVSLALRDKPVLMVTGDGGLMFGLQSLWTIARYETPLIAVVLNNGGWNSMRQSVASGAAAVQGTVDRDYGWACNYADVARALGVRSARVESAEELDKVLAENLPVVKPLFLDVAVQRVVRSPSGR
jgi:benzoylformate decarboxylase